MIEKIDGTIFWYNDLKKGELHRINGPAIEWYNGDKMWYRYGQRHRIEGPAIIYINGFKAYFINGEWIHNFCDYIQTVIKYKKEHQDEIFIK